eukprot:CAMPEP_0177673980 /NCGR_PEP_ID=MMETSP0447-20121125/26287_1 /TAXON_ID=0 /ORGANISM="Stygamoeba regulata, Strain BSH-02190019" /LENGTH=888 /DNA_ID=CAMNT_0019181997 /DNA_START=296 /DNA_END=2962 /DNA_ORIENTATION=+
MPRGSERDGRGRGGSSRSGSSRGGSSRGGSDKRQGGGGRGKDDRRGGRGGGGRGGGGRGGGGRGGGGRGGGGRGGGRGGSTSSSSSSHDDDDDAVTLIGGGEVGEDVGEALITARKSDGEVSGLAIAPFMSDARRLGRKVSILCNHFPFAITPRTIYQYNVDFTPELDRRNLKAALLKDLKVFGQNFVFDGRMCYLSSRIDDGEYEVKTRSGNEYKVSVTFTNEVVASHEQLPQQVYNNLVSMMLRELKLKAIGRQYFDPTQPIAIPQHKVELWPGYFTSVTASQSGVSLIVDVAHRVLRTDTVLDYLWEISERERNWQRVAKKELVNTIVITRYNNRTYHVDDIAFDLTPRDSFQLKTGEKTTYADYYMKMYNKKINDMDQPLLVSISKRKGAPDMILYLVPELCCTTGLTDRMRSDFRVMRDLAQYTLCAPHVRLQKYDTFQKRVNSSAPLRDAFQEWGVGLAPEPLRVEGRVLDQENIFYANSRHPVDQRSGDWSSATRDGQLVRPVRVDSWLLVFGSKDLRLAQQLYQNLAKVAQGVGMFFDEPYTVSLDRDDAASYAQAIARNLREDSQIVVCLLPNSRKDRYDAIKQQCCLSNNTPIPSQCVLAKTLLRKSGVLSVCHKIVQQMNVKMGGALWGLDIPLENTMLIGMDVCHDTAAGGRGGKQSVAGFVATVDEQFTRFWSRCCFQPQGQEIILGLRKCMSEGLKRYFEVNQKLPQRIVVYRDGVGDGQLQAVLDHEVPQLTACFKEDIGEGYEPLLAYVVVKKRIHTRLMIEECGRVSNPPPGTVVDNGCTRKDWYDFFLVPQSCRQGTVTPLYLTVLYSTIDLNPDQLQSLTYKLCHGYANWAGTIRVPNVCQYAHKIAFLIGQNVHKDPDISLRNVLYYL